MERLFDSVIEIRMMNSGETLEINCRLKNVALFCY